MVDNDDEDDELERLRRYRISTAATKVQASSKTAKRAEELSFRSTSSSGRRQMQVSEPAKTFPLDTLKVELEELWRRSGLSDSDVAVVADGLPDFMDPHAQYGLAALGIDSLDESQFDLWRSRCEDWIEASRLMRQLGLEKTAEALHADGFVEDHRLSAHLLSIAMRCKALREVSIRNSRLTNMAVVSLCQHMGARLSLLDLHGTRDFTDTGIKAVAAHSAEVRVVRLGGGCGISEGSLRVLAKYCRKLSLLELTSNMPVSADTLAELAEGCTVERLDLTDEEAAAVAAAVGSSPAAAKGGKYVTFANVDGASASANDDDENDADNWDSSGSDGGCIDDTREGGKARANAASAALAVLDGRERAHNPVLDTSNRTCGHQGQGGGENRSKRRGASQGTGGCLSLLCPGGGKRVHPEVD